MLWKQVFWNVGQMGLSSAVLCEITNLYWYTKERVARASFTDPVILASCVIFAFIGIIFLVPG